MMTSNKEKLFSIREGEDLNEYFHRIATYKDQCGLTWSDVATICNEETGSKFTSEGYRMKEVRYLEKNSLTANKEGFPIDSLNEIRKEKSKLREQRNSLNTMLRNVSRIETIKEIAQEAVDNLDSKFKLPAYVPIKKTNEKEAILVLSDWHYGIAVDSFWNVYNPDVAKKRLAKLRNEVIERLKKEEVNKLHVINLGDLISGRIHTTIRLENRIDVTTQTIEVSELLAELLTDLSQYANIEYHDTLDNHSRLEPNLNDSLDDESMVRIIREFVKLRVADNKSIKIVDNAFSGDIATFDVLGHKCVGVHGDKDKPGKVIESLSLMTKNNYALVLTAHLHHFSEDEQNETIRISNGSLMGTDDFAKNLRLNSKPSQTLIIVSKENITEGVHKINLD